MFKEYCIALGKSFYDPSAYRDAILRWKGFGGLYLCMVAFILGLCLTFVFVSAVNTFQVKELPHLLNQLPDIVIKDRAIFVKDDQKAVITGSNKNFKITIDTSKSESELRDTGTTIGVGKSFVFFQNNGEYEVSYLKGFEGRPIRINKQSVLAFWHQLTPLIKVSAPPLLWLGQIADLLIKAVAVALISYIVTAYMTEEYFFLTRMRLAILALTPSSLISMGLLLIFKHETAIWFVPLVATLYIYVMVILMRNLPPVVEPVIEPTT